MSSDQLPSITINEETNCSKLVAELVLEHFEIPSEERRLDLLIGMGHGYGIGSICGAITGGVFAINNILSKMGASEDQILDTQESFKRNFKRNFTGTNCADILDLHFDEETIEFETRQPRFCGSLMDSSVNEIIEIVNLAINSINPIMTRFNSI